MSIGLLETGSGYWQAIIWVIITVIIGIGVLWLRNKGKEEYKKNTNQTKPFLSGNPELTKEDSHVGASHIYWGFTEALKHYYQPLVNIHTGNINDYSGWIVLVMAIIFIIVGVS
ncbi:MAG: hydrogenase [Atribacterota bacterium]|nr:hydrogenase [Atribacterota bacterium]MDD5496985.1 hydrogenase [Atribacterota bacterium]